MSNITHTFEARIDRLDDVKATFNKVAKRAIKLGLPKPVLNIGKEYAVGAQVYVNVEVSAVDPYIKGWKAVAFIEISDADTNFVFTIKDIEPKIEWRNHNFVCDHCGTARNRNRVYVLRNENGDEKVVGTSCLNDFVATKELANAADAAQFELYVTEAFSGEDWEESGNSSGGAWAVYAYLIAAAVAIERYGFVSRANAIGDRAPTSSDALVLLAADAKGDRDVAATSEEIARATPRVNDAIAWAETLIESLNNYEYNLAVAVQSVSVSRFNAGLLASLIPAYDRHIGRNVEIARDAEISEYVGSVKERIDIEGEIVFIKVNPGYYGDTEMIKIVDADGNHFVWWSSKVTLFNVGNKVAGKATIKDHTEYQGVKQTIITRAKLEVPADYVA